MNQRPLLGMLTSEGNIRALLQSVPRPMMKLLAEAASAAEATLCVFTASGIDISGQRIRAVCLDNKDMSWNQSLIQYPRVFYKRAGPGSAKALYQSFIRQLSVARAAFLNYPFSFSKLDVYNNLSGNREVWEYLPDTRLVHSPKVLSAMLQKYGDVYVKASLGSRGRRVARIRKLSSGRYLMSNFIDEVNTSTYKDIAGLYRDVNRFALRRQCIVQPAIELITLDSCLVDFRAEAQRTAAGKIVTYAIAARVGRRSSPITTHADSFKFEDFLSRCMGYSDEKIVGLRSRADRFLISIYQALEQSYGRCGEIGIDFGLDTAGRLWYIECNSQSAKVSLFNSYDEDTIRLHMQTLVDYAVSIAPGQ